MNRFARTYKSKLWRWAACMACPLLFTHCWAFQLLWPKPHHEKHQIPVTSHVDWWPQQNKMILDSFVVNTEYSQLNLFNSKSLISYHVYGKLINDSQWKPYISKVHVAEIPINKDTAGHTDVELRITPVVSTKKVKHIVRDTIPFQFKNEHIYHSVHWGENRIRLRCGAFEKTIVLIQSK